MQHLYINFSKYYTVNTLVERYIPPLSYLDEYKALEHQVHHMTTNQAAYVPKLERLSI